MKGRRRARGGVGRGGEASSRVRQPVIRRRARGFRFRGGGGLRDRWRGWSALR